MEIRKKSRSGAIVFEIHGKFDIEQTEIFEDALHKILEDKPAVIALDLNNVSYIDSSAIGSIIKALNLTRSGGGDMILFGLQPIIMDVFTMAKLDHFFKIMTAEEMDRQYPS